VVYFHHQKKMRLLWVEAAVQAMFVADKYE